MVVGSVDAGKLLGEIVGLIDGCSVVGSKMLGEIVVTGVRIVGVWDGSLDG